MDRFIGLKNRRGFYDYYNLYKLKETGRSNMKHKKIIIAIISIIALIPIVINVNKKPIKAGATISARQINLGGGVLNNPNDTWNKTYGPMVYLGNAEQVGNTSTEPIPFRILKRTGNTVLLDSDTLLNVNGFVLPYKNREDALTGDVSLWLGGASAEWLENVFYMSEESGFSDEESAIIMKTTLAGKKGTDYKYGDNYQLRDDSGAAHVFSISMAEFMQYYTKASDAIKSNASYQLRTLAKNYSDPGYVVIDSKGKFFYAAEDTDYNGTFLSPAINISADKVAFVKEAGFSNTGFSAISENQTNKWQLALYNQDDTFKLEGTTDEIVYAEEGATFKFSHTPMSSQFYTQMSAMLVNSDNVVEYYGKIADSYDFNPKVTIPKNLKVGGYKLYIFHEQVGGFGETSIVSNMEKIEFTVKKRTVWPTASYTISGTTGQNNYYTSNVTLTAPKGFLISKTANGTFAESITYTQSEASAAVYIKSNDTGEVSNMITVGEILVDTSKPDISGVTSGETLYDKARITVTDDNISKITINGVSQKIYGATNEYSLVADNTKMTYTIVATDKAGNSRTLKFDLAQKWLETGVIPANQSVYLEKNQKYQLASGKNWTVKGDSTEYAGGISFYISSNGDYVFN